MAADEIIIPEEIVSGYISRLIELPGSLQVLDFADSRVQLVAVKAFYGGPLVGQDIPANGFDKRVPISNSVGVGRAEIICGYTGSTGRYGMPAYAARDSSGNAVTPAVALPDYEEWEKSINGPLSGSAPRYVNSNHAASLRTHGETSYQRYASDYYFSGYPSQPQIDPNRLSIAGTTGLNDADQTDDAMTTGLASDGLSLIHI